MCLLSLLVCLLAQPNGTQVSTHLGTLLGLETYLGTWVGRKLGRREQCTVAVGGRAGLQSERYFGTGWHTRKSPGPRHMASTHLSTPAHIILVDAGAHCMYSMQYLSTLGSDPWVPVISRRPVASRRTVEARPSHKSHLSKMQLAPATQWPGPGPGPSPSSASVSHAGLVSQKQTSRLPLCLCLLHGTSTSASFAPCTLLCNNLTDYLPTHFPFPACSP